MLGLRSTQAIVDVPDALQQQAAERCYILLPVQDAPFFTVKLQVKMLPCLIFFQNGVACDRAVGFDDYGASDDFSTTSVERRLLKSGMTSAYYSTA